MNQKEKKDLGDCAKFFENLEKMKGKKKPKHGAFGMPLWNLKNL